MYDEERLLDEPEWRKAVGLVPVRALSIEPGLRRHDVFRVSTEQLINRRGWNQLLLHDITVLAVIDRSAVVDCSHCTRLLHERSSDLQVSRSHRAHLECLKSIGNLWLALRCQTRTAC